MKVKIKHGGETFVVNIDRDTLPTKIEARKIAEELIKKRDDVGKEHDPQQSLDVRDKVTAPFEWLFDSPDVVKEGAEYLKENVNPDSGALWFTRGDQGESKQAGAEVAKKVIDFAAPTRFDLVTLGLGAAAKAAPKVAKEAKLFAQAAKDVKFGSELGHEAGVVKFGGREAGKNPRLLGTNPRAIKAAEQHLDLIVDGINSGESVEAIAKKINSTPGLKQTVTPNTIDAIKKKHKIGGADKEIEDAVLSVAKGEDPVIDVPKETVHQPEESLPSASSNFPPEPPDGFPQLLESPNPKPGQAQSKPFQARELLDVFGPLQRSLLSSTDLSAPLRQGLIPHALPWHWPQAFDADKQMLKVGFGGSPLKVEDRAHDVLQGIMKRPNANVQMFSEDGEEILRNLYNESKLGIADPKDIFPSELAHRIPGVEQMTKWSEGTYGAELDTLRANMFDKYLAKFGFSESHPPSKEEARDIAKAVNTLTGYGQGGDIFESAVPLMQKGFFSPRLNKARWDLLTPTSYFPIPTMEGRTGVSGARELSPKFGPMGRKILRNNMAPFAAGSAAGLYGLDELGDQTGLWDVEFDPRETDFAKVRIGDTRISPLSGYDSMVRLGSRLADYSFNDDSKVDPGFELEKFGRSKLAPGAPTFAADMFFGKGKNVVGEKIRDMDWMGHDFETPYLGYGLTQHTPLFPQEISDSLESDNPEITALTAPLGFLGMGSQTYDKKPKIKDDPMAEIDRMYKKVFGR